MSTLSSPVAMQVIIMITFSVTNDDHVGIVLVFQQQQIWEPLFSSNTDTMDLLWSNNLYPLCHIMLCVLFLPSPHNGPLTRYEKSRAAHAPGMPGTFSPPPRVSDPNMHHGTCVTHMPRCMPGLLTSRFLWSRWRGKHSQYFRRMRTRNFACLVRGP